MNVITATKKPVMIEALRFDGGNFEECKKYIGIANFDNTLNYPNVITSEGVMRVNVGDYIIKEPFDKERGFYPCKPDIFELTYDVSGASSENLLLEIIKREKIFPAPTKTTRTIEHKEIIVGIGCDHTASIIIHDDALKQLTT